MVILYWKQS